MIDNFDILITQDYGLATIALSKNVYVLNHFGKYIHVFFQRYRRQNKGN